MTVTLYSITPPTSHSSRYLLRPTVLVAPPFERCAEWRGCIDVEQPEAAEGIIRLADQLYDEMIDLPCLNCGQPHRRHDTVLDDIDSMYDQTLEDPVGLLEKSAEITRFP